MKYINVSDVVKLTGCSRDEIINLARTGVIPAHKARKGHWRLNVPDVENYFGILINEPIEVIVRPKSKTKPKPKHVEVVSKPAPKVLPAPVFESPQAEGEVSYVADEEHYTKVFKRMTEVKNNLKIATGDLKNFYVSVESDGEVEKIRLCDFFLSLVERGVHVQVVSMDPFYFYLNTKKDCPQLLEHPLFDLRHKKRCHMKIFIFDDECAYFGSANITGAAIGRRAKGNRNNEAGVLVLGTMMQAPLHHFERVWNAPDILKHTWKRFATKAKELEKYNWSYDK